MNYSLFRPHSSPTSAPSDTAAFLRAVLWTTCGLLFSMVQGAALGQEASGVLRGELTRVNHDFELADGAAANGSLLYVPDVKGKQLWAFQTNQPAGEAATSPSVRKMNSDKCGFSGTAFQQGALYLADNAGERIMKMAPGKPPEPFFQFAEGMRPNDLTVDALGRVYVTLTRQGQVQRISADGQRSEVLADGIVSPNGIALSPDENTLYVSEYKPGTVVQIDLHGTVLPFDVRPFVEDMGLRKADGMCSDRAGNVYCAGEDAVWIWSPQGKLLNKVRTPERPINCCFGGSKSIDLYISTFGGVYRQPMNRYGVQPNPPTKAELQAKGRPSTSLEGVSAEFNRVYYQEGDRKLLYDWIEPAKSVDALPAIVLIHGGGWLHGDKTKFRGLAVRLARKGYAVMAIEYRLGYESPSPAGVRDAVASILFLRRNAEQLGIDAEDIAVVGGSAGGHIAGLLGSASNREEFQPLGSITSLPEGHATASLDASLKAVVVMAGPLQISTGSVAEKSKQGMTSNATRWIGASIDSAPEAYRMIDAHLNMELHPSELPPNFLFLTGSLDNPSRNDSSLERLHELGAKGSRKIIHDGARHGHWNQLEWIDQVTEDIVQFLQDSPH